MNDREPVARSVAVERLLDCRADLFSESMTESISLDAIAGRTLPEDLHAPRDVPPREYATMDGYALATADRSSAETSLVVVGEVAPEDEPPEIEPDEAVAIATGAPLPARADAVIQREHATIENGRLSVPSRSSSLASGTNVQERGSTTTAGERLFAADDRLAPRHAALLRDVGVETVRVHEPFSVAIVATGTEIHAGRQPDRDSAFLAGLVRSWGHEPAAPRTVPDDPTSVRETIETAAATHDVVLTTGGTSVGNADHVTSVLADHESVFAGVALRPGRPVTVAIVEQSPVIALPGKPLAAHAAAILVARALFTGATTRPTITADLVHRVGLPEADIEYAIPVVLDETPRAGPSRAADRRAMALGHADSSLPLYEECFAPGLVASNTRMALADGFVCTRTPLEAGEPASVVPYSTVE